MAVRSAQENIDTVARLEQEFLAGRSWKDRLGDTIAAFAGSMTFVLFHVFGFAAWVLINAGWAPGIPPFDPYPYILLTMFVSMEGVLIATFVLMKQNRMSRRADQRDHLNLQIDLLAEKEITKILQLNRLLCEHFGIREAGRDAEVRELSRDTAVERLARELQKKIPNE
jgi:uncharacterized membrane protein